MLLAPLYDLVKLAEDAAITRIISNGRLLLGIDPGVSWQMLKRYEREVHPHIR